MVANSTSTSNSSDLSVVRRGYSLRPRDYFDRCFGLLAPCLAANAWCFCWFVLFVCVCFCAACFCFCFGDLQPMTFNLARLRRVIVEQRVSPACHAHHRAFLKALRTLNSYFLLLPYRRPFHSGGRHGEF